MYQFARKRKPCSQNAASSGSSNDILATNRQSDLLIQLSLF